MAWAVVVPAVRVRAGTVLPRLKVRAVTGPRVFRGRRDGAASGCAADTSRADDGAAGDGDGGGAQEEGAAGCVLCPLPANGAEGSLPACLRMDAMAAVTSLAAMMARPMNAGRGCRAYSAKHSRSHFMCHAFPAGARLMPSHADGSVPAAPG
jgi:hypothetical protein